MDECVLAGKRAAALTGNVVVGVGAVFEGVSGSEVVVGEATCTGCVQLPVTVMVLLPSVNSDEKRGMSFPGRGIVVVNVVATRNRSTIVAVAVSVTRARSIRSIRY